MFLFGIRVYSIVTFGTLYMHIYFFCEHPTIKFKYMLYGYHSISLPRAPQDPKVADLPYPGKHPYDPEP